MCSSVRSWLSTIAAVIAVAVELERGEAEHEAGRPRVADQALGPGGEPPDLLATAPRLGRVGHLELRGVAGRRAPARRRSARRSSGRSSRSIPPAARTSRRVSTRLRRRLAGVVEHVEAERLDQDRAVGQRPGAARVELGLLLDPLQARAWRRTARSPPRRPTAGRATSYGRRGRVGPVVGDRGEQARLAQPGRERPGGPIGLGRRLEAIEPAALVDDVELAGVVGAEAGDVERRIDQLAVPERPSCRRA